MIERKAEGQCNPGCKAAGTTQQAWDEQEGGETCSLSPLHPEQAEEQWKCCMLLIHPAVSFWVPSF